MEPCILKALVLVIVLSGVSSQICPRGCTCSSNVITCTGLSSFPNLLGTTEEFLTISRSRLSDIPPNAFRLSSITNINIRTATIGRITNCAFGGMRGVRFIAIYQSTIDTIETGAFTNITFDDDSSNLNIYEVSITTIQPYAFSSFKASGSLQMYKANVTTIRPFAFHNLTLSAFTLYSMNINDIQSNAFSNFSGIKNINFYLNYVALLRCDTINKLKVNASNSLNINRVYLNCDCNIAWLLRSGFELPATIDCRGPPNLAERSLRDLNVTVVCPSGNYSTTCPSQSLPGPGPCPTPTAVASHTDLDVLLLLTLMVSAFLMGTKC